MSYRLALLSHIPIVRSPAGDFTLDLWARDLNAQTRSVCRSTLFCPVLAEPPRDWQGLHPVDPSILVVDLAAAPEATSAALAECDLVQLPGNFSWRQSGSSRRFLRLARRLGKPVVVGISSNRARTAVLNAAASGWPKRLRAAWRYASIRASQSYLVWRSNGVFVVGEGLQPLVQRWNANVFVGTASWIRESDIAPERGSEARSRVRLGVACRLEAMKGVHLAIEAARRLSSPDVGADFDLRIIGSGPEAGRLQARVAGLGLEGRVRFEPALPYPEAFFAWLREIDLLLLTNLNDEQPRVLFDAISQGAVPICPDTAAYRALGIPAALRYRLGDDASLAEAIEAQAAMRAHEGDGLATLRADLRRIARHSTIEAMHAERARWIAETVLRRATAMPLGQ